MMDDYIPVFHIMMAVINTLLLETEYSGLFGQYHVWWYPSSLSRQGISRHGFDSRE